ncbi:MAG: bifunctional (p)ppGpp synthetase/guanosine-3',5'-bis(diphosphate) 3'-pyrophosphohydrolase, partial [Vicinamibacterales bacterium]
MIRFETLLEKVRSYSPDADLELLRRAYVFSALEHKGQVRHSGEPYLVHPLEVADFLADMKLDVVAVAAGLLHDVVEDTLTSPERIAELFGPEVAHVVEGVTKIGAIPFSSSEERQAENFRKMLLAMVDDIRVILVKLADRLHNMRTLGHLPEERRLKIAQETLDIYAPIANRLGMSKVKNELEELAFKYLEPKAYEALRSKVEALRRTAEPVSQELIKTIRAKLEDAQVPVIHIDGRIKRLYSIHLKLKRQKIDLERVYDFVALRVVTQSVRDCYAALGIIHQTWSPVPGRIKDFIAMPRPNGYQSLHTSVISERGFPFEVQIRTEEMHRRAEEGIAAHWKYKEGRVGDQRDERYFQWMRQLLEVQQEVRDPQEFLRNLKIDLYPEEVYIFTPKGEVRSLPRGATPVDFAYSIHTDVGTQCSGARVNGRMVPLRTRLQNGDIVEIITQSGHKPSRDWLSFVVTSRARSKIRHVLQGEERARSIELGRRLLEKEARRFDLNVRTLLESDGLLKFATEYGARNAEELVAHIGYGKIAARTVLQKATPPGQLKERAPDSAVVSVVKRVLRPGGIAGDKITVRGTDDVLVFRA